MAGPIRIQRKRQRGWRKPDNTKCVDRGTPWGNPFKVGPDMSPEEAVKRYRELGEDALPDAIIMIRGMNLACYCPLDQPCHADVLLEWANQKDGPKYG